MPAFMQLPNMPGECEEEEHNEWIGLTSFSYGVSRTIPHDARGAQRRAGEPQISDIMVTKQADKSSAKVQKAVADGTHLDEVVIHLCSTINNVNCIVMEYKLKDVIITSYNVSGTGEGQPMESLSMNFTKMEVDYVQRDHMGEDKGHNPATIDSEKWRTS